MNFKLTLSLVIVLCLIVIAWLFFPEKKAADITLQTGTPLFSPAPASLHSIQLSRNGAEQLAFQKTDDQWFLTFPIKAKVSTQNFAPVFDSLRTLTYQDKTEPGSSDSITPESTGTDNPKYQIQFTDDAGKSYTLGLGKTDATEQKIYATLNSGKTIFLLDSNPLTSFDQDPAAFREKDISIVDADQIAAFTITQNDKSVTLQKTDGNWMVSAPISARGNADAAAAVVDGMKSIQAAAFPNITRDLAGLTAPVLTVTAEITPKPKFPTATGPAATAPTEKPTPVTLQFGYYKDLTTKQEIYAALAGSDDVFTLPATVFTNLNKDLQQLRDPAITPVDVTAATQISMTPADYNHDPDRFLTLEKIDGQWRITSYINRLRAGDTETAQWLLDIRNLRAIKFVDNAGNLKSIGLDPPSEKIDITVPGRSQHEILLIGKPETADNVTPVMRQGEPTVYLVQTSEAQKAIPTIMDVRDKTIEALSADSIRTISITGPAATGGGVTLAREGTAWKQTPTNNPKAAGVADDSAITALLADFTPLTAQKYLAAAADIKDKGDLALNVTIQGVESSVPTTAPSTNPATLPAPAIGPIPQKTFTRTLALYKSKTGNWSALWNGGTEPWPFEPTPDLIKQLTASTYAAPTTTQAATQPAAMPAGILPQELTPAR